ncbi:MAG TPA: hypothetical protein VFZ41_06385 [Solirubrobacterales bacterium]
MLGTYASAALICAASLLVGRALWAVAGRRSCSWLEPVVGFGAMLTVTGIAARLPGHATTGTLGLILLLAAAAIVVAVRPRSGGATEAPNGPTAAPRSLSQYLREGLPVAVVTSLVLSIPFAVSGRWGLLGVGFNNDLGLHLAWAEWLRSGFGPTPEAGYPLGPHGLADAVAAFPGIGLGQAFVGQIVAIGVITALTAMAALPGAAPLRRLPAAAFVAIPYLAASYYAQGAFKETAEALFVLAFAVALADLDRRRAESRRVSAGIVPSTGSAVRFGLAALPFLALAGGVFFAYSFAGLAWPIAIVALWSLTRPEVRQALAPRALLRFLLRPATLLTLTLLAGLGVVATVVGPFGFATGFNKVAGSNTYGPVSPVEALGVWWSPNYRLDAPGEADLPWLAGAIGGAALALGLIWWLRRRELAVPIALAACALLYAASLPFSGEYSQAKALMIAAPLAMLIAIRPLLAERLPHGLARLGYAALALAFVGGAAYSSFLALRDTPVGPPGHGAELRAFLPTLHGKPVLYAGQDRYAAYELLGADAHVPLVEFPAPGVHPNPQKPFDTGDAYSPLDFDSFTRRTLDRFQYVITGRAAWNSEAPPNFRRIDATPSFLLWERTGPTPEGRRVLVEGTDGAAWADCDQPEIRILLGLGGRASVLPDAVVGSKGGWDEGSRLRAGERTSQTLRLPPGRWRLSLQYFSPFDLTLTAAGFRRPLKPALDGQRPNTISLANAGQFWPAGEIVSRGGRIEFTLAAAEPSTLQRLTGYRGTALIGNLVAVPAEPREIVPLAQACDRWIDWYEAQAASRAG